MSIATAQYWQTLRPLRKVGKLRGVIEVPSFTAPAGNKSALDLSVGGGVSVGTQFQPSTEFTIRFWFKTLSTVDEGIILGNNSCFVKITNTKQLLVAVQTSDAYNLTSQMVLAPNTWYYVYVIYRSQKANLYVGGVFDSQSETFGVGNISIPVDQTTMGSYTGTGSASVHLSTTELWTKALLPSECNEYMYTLHYRGADAALKYMFNFREYLLVSAGSYYIRNLVTGTTYTFSPDDADWANDFPHVYLYNCNFIAGRFIITTNQPFSFRYPVVRPDDANYVLCVSDGSARYRFWPDDNFQTNPEYPVYMGEVLSSGSYLEVWNIQGEETLTAVEVQDILTSILHVVTSPTEIANTADATITINTELAAFYPIAFPMTFDSQQLYPGTI